MNRYKTFIKNPLVAFSFLLHRMAPLIKNDKLYLKLDYFFLMRKKLRLDNPVTFNEKLQWLKLYNRKAEYTTMVDKYACKDYVSRIIGPDYIIPTIGVWDKPEDIDFDELPDQFVLKVTHDSGGLTICKDKSKLNRADTVRKLKKALETDYYIGSREWPYKDVKKRIIAEKYMEDETGELRDYKFFCFNGNPEFLFIASDRQKQGEETKFDFFDMDFNHLPFTNGHPNSTEKINVPRNFGEMKAIAAKLSKNIPHVRVDLYDINGNIFFGELTFFHWSGLVPFKPAIWDEKFGSLIVLPEKIIS